MSASKSGLSRPGTEGFDDIWDRMSDAELLATEPETDNPMALAHISETIPPDVGEFYVEAEYHIPPERPEVRCAHCERHERHRHGYVVRTATARYLVGSSCGPKAFGTDYAMASLARTKAMRRLSALRRLKRLQTTLPYIIETVDLILASPDLSEFDRLREELRRGSPKLMRALQEVAKGNGRLAYKDKEEDVAGGLRAMEAWNARQRINAAEALQQRTETLRKRHLSEFKRDNPKPNLPLFKDVETDLGTMAGRPWLDPKAAPAAALEKPLAELRWALENCENTDVRTVAFLEGVSKRASEALNRAQLAATTADAVGMFFETRNLLRVTKWAGKALPDVEIRVTGKELLVTEDGREPVLLRLSQNWQAPGELLLELEV